MLNIFTQTFTLSLGQFTRGENFSILQALFTTGAILSYVQNMFGWAGVNGLLLRVEGGQFKVWHIATSMPLELHNLIWEKLSSAADILLIIPQFSSVKLHSHNHHRFSYWAGQLAGRQAGDCQTKVVVICRLLGDVEVLPMVVKADRYGLKVWRQHLGWEG